MHELRGTLNVIDTCSINNFGSFYFTLKLLSEYESLVISYCLGMNAIISQLSKVRILSKYAVDSRHT